MTAPRVPQVSLECQVLKGTKVFQASQGEKVQKVKRYIEKQNSFLFNKIHILEDTRTFSGTNVRSLFKGVNMGAMVFEDLLRSDCNYINCYV